MGKDIQIEEIREANDTVFLDTGAWKQPILGIDGEKLTQFGLNFLVEVKAFMNRQIGREVLVMIEGKVADENAYVGRTYKDAPNVDGLIFVNTDEELMSGDLARVKVTGAAEYDLIGELM